MNSRRTTFLALAATALLLFAYGNSFGNGFRFDDRLTVELNPGIRSLSLIPQYFFDAKTTSVSPARQYYQPPVTLSLAIDYAIQGLDPRSYHRSSFIFYIVIIFLSYALFLRLFSLAQGAASPTLPALIATAAFAFQAPNAEVLNYIGSRPVLLGVALSLLSLFLATKGLEGRGQRWYLIPLAIACLCEPLSFVCAPLLTLFYLLFQSEVDEPCARRCKRAMLRAVPSWLTVIAFCSLANALSVSETYTIPSLDGLHAQIYVWAEYAVRFFYPFGLVSFRSADYTEASFTYTLGCLLVHAALITVTAAMWRTARSKIFVFGVLWFYLSLATLFALPRGSEYLDYRRFLMPYLGLALATTDGSMTLYAWAQSRVWWSLRCRAYLGAFLLLFLSLQILQIRHRNRIWSSEERLWFDLLSQDPQNGSALLAYGYTKLRQGDNDIARIYFEEAQARLSPNASLFVGLGTVYGRIRSNPALPERYFKEALRLEPQSSEALEAYARWLILEQRFSDCVALLEQRRDVVQGASGLQHVELELYQKMGRRSKVMEIAKEIARSNRDDGLAKRILSDQRPATR